MTTTIEHSNCGRCGRKLKTTKSMKEGFGPVCKRKFEEEKAHNQMTIEESLGENTSEAI